MILNFLIKFFFKQTSFWHFLDEIHVWILTAVYQAIYKLIKAIFGFYPKSQGLHDRLPLHNTLNSYNKAGLFLQSKVIF